MGKDLKAKDPLLNLKACIIAQDCSLQSDIKKYYLYTDVIMNYICWRHYVYYLQHRMQS